MKLIILMIVTIVRMNGMTSTPNKKYLFFDIECSNGYPVSSKICSFGYVLTDNEFNVI